MSEDRESKRSIEAPGGGLLIAYSKNDMFEPGERCGATQHFAHQAACDTLSAMRLIDKDPPDPGLVPLFEARATPETDRPNQLSTRKRTQDIVVVGGGGLALAENLHRRRTMFLRRRAKGEWFLFEGLETESPEGIGILRAEGANLYIHYLGQFSIPEVFSRYVS